MTIYSIYTIYDTVRQEFAPVFTAKNDRDAARQTSNFYNNNQFKDEFLLIKLAEYEQDIDLEKFRTSKEIVQPSKRDISYEWRIYLSKKVEEENQ